MPVSFFDLQLAFEFVRSGGMGENEAYLDRESGKIYWRSEFGDSDEELPRRHRRQEIHFNFRHERARSRQASGLGFRS